jgi:hypothetical protein
MTDGMNNREKAFENKFARDEELKFKTETGAIRLMGHWAAATMGLKDKAANDYAEKLVVSKVEGKNEKTILTQVQKDFAEAKIEMTERQLQNQLSQRVEKARKALKL